MQSLVRAALLVTLVLLPSCGGRRIHAHATVPASEASLLVVAVDGDGYAIEGVQVEILSVWHEWSGLRVQPDPFYSYLETDEYGEAYFSSTLFAWMTVGFLLGNGDVAVLSSDPFEDEASIRVRVSAPGLGGIEVDVDIDELHASGYLEVEF